MRRAPFPPFFLLFEFFLSSIAHCRPKDCALLYSKNESVEFFFRSKLRLIECLSWDCSCCASCSSVIILGILWVLWFAAAAPLASCYVWPKFVAGWWVASFGLPFLVWGIDAAHLASPSPLCWFPPRIFKFRFGAIPLALDICDWFADADRSHSNSSGPSPSAAAIAVWYKAKRLLLFSLVSCKLELDIDNSHFEGCLVWYLTWLISLISRLPSFS